MRSIYLLLMLVPVIGFTQPTDFKFAYTNHPDVPAGLLEAVAWSRTHMSDIDSTTQPSCSGMPLPFGIMGLFGNGAGYFNENARQVASISGISIAAQKQDNNLQIAAYAEAYSFYAQGMNSLAQGKKIRAVLLQLSEIPDTGLVNDFARNAQVYKVLKRMENDQFARKHNFPSYNFEFDSIFGAQQAQVLAADQIELKKSSIKTASGVKYEKATTRSAQYGPAIWNPAPSCNYSYRGGVSASAITIHTIQGSYAGAISWSQNCNSNVSFHYVLRSSDGQVTQMVNEQNKAWHVGSENPYTIGYEHEGYVSNPSWYTNAMYNSSADLSKNICNSGYGISPLRTYDGPANLGSNVLGSCIKIKGHQHFPNQTHNDPGIFWDWEKYYKLINDSLSVQTITTSSGNFYDSGGASADYGNDERKLWLIQPPQTNSITINFSSFNIESLYDNMFIYDGSSISDSLIGQYTGPFSPGSITSSGGSLLIEFRSDCSVTAPGWVAGYTSVAADSQAPSTTIDSLTSWQTEDFNATFDDQDNTGGSGIAKALYSVSYDDGNRWRANHNRGFIDDQFTSSNLQADWTEQMGNWSQNAGVLQQSNESSNNTNIYRPLAQNLSNNYLFHWKGKIGGTGSNRRAGLHIFCSDPTASNRQDSYFVWLRVDQNKVQFYKVTNNSFGAPLVNVSMNIDPNTLYDLKLNYNRISGKILFYIDDQIVATWTDSNPIANGSHVSFRTGNASAEIHNFEVYRSRYPSVSIKVGSANTNDVRKQNPNPTSPAGKIKSITYDQNNNLSSIDTEMVDIDWTAPQLTQVIDGNNADIDTTYQALIEAHWPNTTDPHSGVNNYDVAIGSQPGDDDIKTWSAQGNIQTFSHTLVNPIYNQIYYVGVRAYNNAGLDSTLFSDGQTLLDESSKIAENKLNNITLYPNPASDRVQIKNLPKDAKILIYSIDGALVSKTSSKLINTNNWSSGVYQVVIQKNNQMIIKKLVVQ